MGQIKLPTGAAPPTPPSGQVAVYAGTDKRLYQKDDAGLESPVGGLSYAFRQTWSGAFTSNTQAEFFHDGGDASVPFLGGEGTPVGDANIQSIKRLFVNVSFNSNTEVTRFEIYLNGSASGLFIDVPAATTGVFSETSTSLSGIVPGDLIMFTARSLVAGAGTVVVEASVLYDTGA